MKAFIVLFLVVLSSGNVRAEQEQTLEVVNRFYQAFQAGDAFTMGQQYADSDVDVFTDEIFVKLSLRETRKMWAMLLNTPHKPVVKFEPIVIGEEHAIVHWEADYVFPKTGRHIHNDVTSTLYLRDGKIVKQYDRFDLCAWARQGFGVVKGTAICTFPDLTVRKQARQSLEAFNK